MQVVYGVFVALFVLMAITIAVKLPRYLRLTKIAEQLRSKAGFLEEQQALLQAIQDSVSDGILLIGEDGQMKAFNAAALRILWGREELRLKPLQEMKESAISALVQSPSDQNTVLWEGRRIERFKTVVPGYGQLYVFRDITEEKRVSEEKERLQAKLMEAQRLESLGRLAEGVGHEFNNLLTGIMGNAGLALDRLPPGDPVGGMLEDVIRASERAAAISRQLLAYSGDTGRSVAHPLNLSRLVEDLSGLAQASISKRVQLRLELEANLPLVEADPAKIRQVALNLIANGAEAIGNAGGTVRVKTGVAEIDAADAPDVRGLDALAPGRYVYLEVSDDGCGMDEETQSHIFDPFFTTKAAGRGLGLAAVLGIVRAHRGAIKVNSQPGKGSAFRVLLPVVAARIPESSTTAPAEHSDDAGTVLVMEDEPIVRRATLAALSQYGFDVRAAENGAVGVEMFEQMADTISLVLIDLVMPVMGGEEALARIKRIRPDVPVVICSGYNEVESMRFNENDVAGIVKKPFTAKQLVDQLKSALERHAVQQRARSGD